MDDTPEVHETPPDDDDDDLSLLEAADPADAPDIAERIADRLQTALDEPEETPS